MYLITVVVAAQPNKVLHNCVHFDIQFISVLHEKIFKNTKNDFTLGLKSLLLFNTVSSIDYDIDV